MFTSVLKLANFNNILYYFTEHACISNCFFTVKITAKLLSAAPKLLILQCLYLFCLLFHQDKICPNRVQPDSQTVLVTPGHTKEGPELGNRKFHVKSINNLIVYIKTRKLHSLAVKGTKVIGCTLARNRSGSNTPTSEQTMGGSDV